MYIGAACRRFSEMTGIVINPSVIEYRADVFGDVVRLYRSPVSEITSITYNDKDGNEQEIAPSKLVFDNVSRPARLVIKGEKWPKTDGTPGNIKIRFNAGHETLTELDELIEWAILSMVAHMYEHREEVSDENRNIVPSSAQMVINMYEFKEVS
jgi:uncharacterized phiE125 gp8 family phage protein